MPEGAGIYPPTPASGSGPDPSPSSLLFPLPPPPHLSFKKPAGSTSQTQESDPCLPPALPPRSSHQRPAWTTAVASSLVSPSPLESRPPPPWRLRDPINMQIRSCLFGLNMAHPAPHFPGAKAICYAPIHVPPKFICGSPNPQCPRV